MRVDAETLPDEMPQAPGVYSFAYEDSYAPGTHIQERLCVDLQLGIFDWRRSALQKGSEVELGHGGAWATSAVCNVQFATKWGDPSREFLLATQPYLVWRRALLTRLSLFAAMLLRIATFTLNPLALSLILSCALTGELWRTFPASADGTYSMSEPANESALAWSMVLSVFCVLIAVIAGWWLGVFRFACFKRDSAFCGTITRLPRSASHRWEAQRLVNAAVLLAFLTWCLVSLVICPVALGLNAQEECAPYVSPSVSLASSAVSPISGVLDPCYRIDGMPLVCGVGPCSCSAARELSCLEPPSPPASTCRRVPRPLCAGSDGGAAADPSGIHGWLVANAISSAVMSCALGLCWCMNAAALLLNGPPSVVTAQVPTVQYHRFDVSFRLGEQEPLIVLLDAKEDPLAVFASLMPMPVHVPPGTPARLRRGSSIPGSQDSEPQWC